MYVSLLRGEFEKGKYIILHLQLNDVNVRFVIKRTYPISNTFIINSFFRSPGIKYP